MEFWTFTANEQATCVESLDKIPAGSFVWLVAHHNELSQVTEKIEQLTEQILHPEHMEDCANLRHPCFYDDLQSYELIIYRSLCMSNSVRKFKTQMVSCVLFDNLLVTLHDEDQAIESLRKKIHVATRFHPKTPAVLLYHLLLAMTDKFLNLRDLLTEKFETWQNELLDQGKRFNRWREFLDYKNVIQKVYMLCEAQLDVASQWRAGCLEEEADPQMMVNLSDLESHVRRGLKFSQQMQYQVDSLMQLHYSLSTTVTNQVVQLLTVISCIFLPLTLLTGVFGMNFEHMPFLHSPSGFYALLIAMVLIIVGLLSYFKKKRWI